MATARSGVFTAAGKSQEAKDADTQIVSGVIQNGSGSLTINSAATSVIIKVGGNAVLTIASSLISAAQPLSMGGNKITGLGSPTASSTEAATASFAEAAAAAAKSGSVVTLVSYGQLTTWLANNYAGPFGISEGAYFAAENGPIPWKAPCAGTLKNFRLQAVYTNGVTTNATAYKSTESSSPVYSSTAVIIPVASGVAFGVYAGSLAVAEGDLLLFQLSQSWATPAMIVTAQFIPTSA